MAERKNISIQITNMLWAASGGRCEFPGCNKILYAADLTKDIGNFADRAHIWGVNGARSDDAPDGYDKNAFENLLLLCSSCHKIIDKKPTDERYPDHVLQEYKKQHEARIRLVTGIDPGKSTHIVHYTAVIGHQNPIIDYKDTSPTVFPKYYPASISAIELGAKGSKVPDNMRGYYVAQLAELEYQFNHFMAPLLNDGQVHHFSLFALAPMPLLIKLGTYFSDIYNVDVRQLRREPSQTWHWLNEGNPIEVFLKEPSNKTGSSALNISFSASIENDRIEDVIGKDSSIWTLFVKTPNRDCIKSVDDLSIVRKAFRDALDVIKQTVGQSTTLNVFPAMPISSAVELGRVWMPKADLSLKIYDQNKTNNAFEETITIK